MKKLSVFGSIAIALSLSCSATAQDMPAGNVVQSIACSLNEGVSMNEVVTWARNVPREADTSPGAIFFRQSIFGGNFRENNDFVIASYWGTYENMDSRVQARGDMPANRVRSGVRASDLYTCNPSSLRVSIVRGVNPGNDGFTGDQTIMTTRFCRLNEGETVADAYAFAQGVAANYREGGHNGLMQLSTRGLTPVGNTVAGSGVVITAVPATRQAWRERMDYGRENNVLEGLSLPMACDYPMMWITNAVYRQQNN